MRKILNLFSPLVIEVKINKQPIFAVIAFWHFVITSLVNINKRLFNAIITSWNLLIIGVVNITKQVMHATVTSLHAVLNSFRFLITSLVTLNKQLFHATVVFLHAIVSFFGFVISNLIRLIKQSISAVLNSCSFVITSIFRINKQFIHGAVAFFGISIVSSSSFIIDSLIRINKQVISGIVSFLGAFLYSLGAVLSSMGFVLTSLVRINKQIIHTTVAFPRFVVTSPVRIGRFVITAIPTFLLKIIISCSFVIASLVVIVAFITATTYTQLAVAIALYPLLVYFAFKLIPQKIWKYSSKKPVTEIHPPVESTEKIEEVKEENVVGISDIDKRVFLKLIGGAGLFLFLFSILNKKAENLFFKNLPGSGKYSLNETPGNNTVSAQSQAIDGYKISEIDDNVISFYGFTNKDGGWYIMRLDTDTGSFRYAKGGSNFPSNWTSRENLKYDYFHSVFKN